MTATQPTSDRPSHLRGRSPLEGRTFYEQLRIAAFAHDWPDDMAHQAANDAVRWLGNDRCITQADFDLALQEALGGD